MNYRKIYNDLIESATLRPKIPMLEGYIEKHHIIPRSIGGTNEKSNLVELSAREHFIAHWLLYRIYQNTPYSQKMAYAFHSMCELDRHGKRYYHSRGFVAARKAKSQSMIGIPKSKQHREKIAAKNKERAKDPEFRKKISKALKGLKRKPFSPEHKKKISQHQSGRSLSPETKMRMSEAGKNKIFSEEHRQRLSEAAKKRWHARRDSNPH